MSSKQQPSNSTADSQKPLGSNSSAQKSAQQADEGDRPPLPFEPGRKKAASSAKAEKASVLKSSASPSSSKVGKASSAGKTSPSRRSPSQRASSEIPDAVNRRMLKRMALFCGLPTLCGVLTFFVSYFITVREIFPLPHTAVLLVSLGFFGLGVLGLSYGALSASWDEFESGSLFGVSEFQTNFGRLTSAWREENNSKQKSQQRSKDAE
jgi:hypothetical protein